MSIGGALIGAGANLLGGLLGKKEKSAYRNTRDAMIAQAETAIVAGERYGFNPLTLLGVSSPVGPSDGGSNVFGNAVADAGMILADAMSKQHDVGRLARAERLNTKLQKQVTDLTLRPVVPGVYGAQNGGFYDPQGGARNAGSAGLHPRSSGNSGGVGQSLPRVNPIAPGREVDVLPLPNSPGVFEVDNAVTGGPVTIPGDQEPWGIDELATAAVVGGPQAAWNWGTHWGLELKKAQGGMTPGEKVRGKGSSKTGKGRLRETLGMFPTIGGFPNPWFDQPLKYRY